VAAHQTVLSTQWRSKEACASRCLNQLGERITSLQGVTSRQQAQHTRLPSGQPAMIMMLVLVVLVLAHRLAPALRVVVLWHWCWCSAH
jgi:hypothetical protein